MVDVGVSSGESGDDDIEEMDGVGEREVSSSVGDGGCGDSGAILTVLRMRCLVALCEEG
jgi:hypothetical protein